MTTTQCMAINESQPCECCCFVPQTSVSCPTFSTSYYDAKFGSEFRRLRYIGPILHQLLVPTAEITTVDYHFWPRIPPEKLKFSTLAKFVNSPIKTES